MNNPYLSTDLRVRAILDKPRWHEWIEFECEHLNKQANLRANHYAHPDDVPPTTIYTLAYFKPDALEWSYYQDEVLRGGHEMVCLLDRMANSLPKEHHRYLHRGLTSSNVIDSCNHRRFNRLVEIYNDQYSKLYMFIRKMQHQPVCGMTHGRFADITSVHDRMRSISRRFVFDNRLEEDVYGGPTGDNTSHRQCVPRSDYWMMWVALARCTFTIEQMATDYRFYCSDLQCGVKGEMISGATSSSCMPGKVNPSRFERMCSVGYLIRNQITMMMLQPPQWLDRDLVHSAMERATFDLIWDRSFYLIEQALELFPKVRLTRSRDVCENSSYEKLHQYLDEGLSYAEARAKASAFPPG